MPHEDRSDRIIRDGPELLWEQVVDDIASDIASGKLPPRAQLPGTADLAAQYDVSRVTIHKAKRVLIQRGLVRSVSGKGTFVVGS